MQFKRQYYFLIVELVLEKTLFVGQTMYDHAGLVTLYKKPVSTQNSLFNSTEIERINNLSGIPKGFEFKVFDTTGNQNNYENLSSITYNKAESKCTQFSTYKINR